ncbi:hypothetical protein A5742_17405 [Mycolicibacterium fortuitum]|uniref:Uncharacterized protein n=1 Tax=Mycolicibacterium fortuitum TaxID=1766 RepID=A0ABD6QSY4_MYCFO|nr:hypothetical protein [Mycolicibacterium fortuitum]OMC51915.1 hypothetical protein A5742_17405 [Mycolicibacterium fortuitum]
MLDEGKILRAVRDFTPAVLGLLLVLAIRQGGCGRAWAIAGVTALLVAGLIGHIRCRTLLPNQPDRAVFWVAVRTYGLVGGVYTVCYAAVMYIFSELAHHALDETGKYFFSAASGFAVALLTNALIKPGESDSWGAFWWRKTYRKAFKPFFRVLVDDDDLDGRGGGAWLPYGNQMRALEEDEFDDDDRVPTKRISGWGYRARRERARFLRTRIPDPQRIKTSNALVHDSVKVSRAGDPVDGRVGEVVQKVESGKQTRLIVDFGDPDYWWSVSPQNVEVIDPAASVSH